MMNKLLVLFISLCLQPEIIAQYNFPLSISSNKRHLIDANKRPFPILGRTAWFIISLPEEGYKTFIQNSKSHGFNALEMAAITHWPTGNNAPFNGRGELPFLKKLNGEWWDGQLTSKNLSSDAPDFTSPNESYWQYMDRFLQYCADQNLLVFMFPAYAVYNGGEQGWMREMVANGTVRMEEYGNWVAQRYKNYTNIVWMLLGDRGEFNTEQRNVKAALIKGLKKVTGQKSTLYTGEAHSGQNVSENIDFGPEMTINGVYT